MDPFAGIIATAKKWIAANKHIPWICFDIDGECIDAAIIEFLLVFGKQILDDGSGHINVDYNLKDAARVYMEAIETVERKRRVSKWMVPPGCPPIQRFLSQMDPFLCKLYTDFSLSDMETTVTAHRWSGL